MKLVTFPLTIIIIVALLSMLGVGSEWNSRGSIDASDSYDGWYDNTGHQVMYANYTPSDEWGKIYVKSDGNYWINQTGVVVPYYEIYDNPYGEEYNKYTADFDVGGALGLIGLVVGIMIIAIIAGIRLFGSGVSDFSVGTIVKGGALLALWAIFSVLSLTAITSIEALGPIIYFLLTAMYTVGTIRMVGNSGGND